VIKKAPQFSAAPGEQLKMFAPARDIVRGLVVDGTVGSEETDFYTTKDGPLSPREESVANAAMMRGKLAESKMSYDSGVHGGGVYDSVKEKGFQGHITMDLSRDTPTVWEGHHRLAAASSLDQFVGLEYRTRDNAIFPPENSPEHYNSRYPQNSKDDAYWGGPE